MVPQSFRSDYRGQLVSCSHYLQVTLQTSFGITNPTVRLPVRIHDQYVAATVLGVLVPEEQEEAADEVEEDDNTNALPAGETHLPCNWTAVVATSVVLDNNTVVESIDNTKAFQDASAMNC